jgi:predicted acetyltransferase
MNLMRLRPFRIDDETAALAAHADLKPEGFTFLLDYRQGEPWDHYIARREANRRGDELPEGAGWVPSTFLAASVDGELVGRVSIRHELNDWLAAHGGHIGYAIVPSRRRRGHATAALRQGLVIARSLGIDEVLVICNDDNVASARVIERCGGELESVIAGEDHETRWRRYWIR